MAHAGGRPSKITEAAPKILTALRAGNTRRNSAAYAGIPEGTFYQWMAKGEAQATGQYREFREGVVKAEADAEAGCVAVIMQARLESWTASAWWLERRRTADWGQRTQLSEKEVDLIVGSLLDALAEETHDDEVVARTAQRAQTKLRAA